MFHHLRHISFTCLSMCLTYATTYAMLYVTYAKNMSRKCQNKCRNKCSKCWNICLSSLKIRSYSFVWTCVACVPTFVPTFVAYVTHFLFHLLTYVWNMLNTWNDICNIWQRKRQINLPTCVARMPYTCCTYANTYAMEMSHKCCHMFSICAAYVTHFLNMFFIFPEHICGTVTACHYRMW